MLKKGLLKRKSNEQSLGEVIQDYLRESGWQQKLDEIKIITEWDKMLGPTLAKYTDEVFIKNKQLHIRLKSATLRQELSYQKSELVQQLNNSVGKEVITDVILK
tara:strand:+ start:1880 stop:2191 length:312 start_codon:yes stop_codon:yes gene_type:complete